MHEYLFHRKNDIIYVVAQVTWWFAAQNTSWFFFFLLFLCKSGDQSGKIVIWNMAPVRDENKEKDENVPKMLCQMDNHLGRFWQRN